MLRASLGTGLFIAAALVVAVPASAGDRSFTPASAAVREVDGCLKPEARQPAERCALVEPVARRQVLSDHSMAYDAQGNPLDRNGDIVAVPGRGTQAREVFAGEWTNFR